jgi:hypothetical protein
MKRTLATLVVTLLLCGAASAQTIFDTRDDLKSVRKYKDFLQSKRQSLYAPDKSVRKDTFALLKNSAASPVREGDSIFAMLPLAEFVMAVAAPQGGKKPDDSLQSDAVDLLIEYAKDSKQTLTARENALGALGQIAAAEKLQDFGWNKDSVKALAAVADGKDPLLVHAAFVGLGKVAVKSGKDWRDLADTAAKAMVARLGDKDPLVQRLAFLECLRVIQNAREFNDATERTWDKLTAYLGDIRSPALQDEVKTRYSAIVAERQGSVFRKQAAAAKKELDRLSPIRKLASDSLADLLVTVREQDDPVKLEAALTKIIEDTKNDRALQLYAFSAMGSAATQPEVSGYKLQVIGDAQIELARRTGSPLMYYRAASTLLGLASIHHDSSKASVPLVVLARLIASTDQPALVIPVLDEVRDMALTDLPAWLDSRLIALLFLQAADSPVDGNRAKAFQDLAQVGQDSRNWAMRYEVLTRMEQLEKLSKDSNIQGLAAKWN